MVLERYVQTAADMRQSSARQVPVPLRQFHGTDEASAGRAQTVSSAARVEYPPVELRVVGGQKPRGDEPPLQGRPKIKEGRRLAHVFPPQPVDPSEREASAGWTDEIAARLHDLAATAGREADGAGAIVAGVRQLEVDCHEGVDGLGYHPAPMLATKPANRTASNATLSGVREVRQLADS